MCGRLKYDEKPKFGATILPGEFTWYTTSSGEEGTAKWDGFRRSENLGLPTKEKRTEVIIPAKTYTEKHKNPDGSKTDVWFKVPEGYGIRAMKIGDKLCIVTRRATSEELAQCNHIRQPMFNKLREE